MSSNAHKPVGGCIGLNRCSLRCGLNGLRVLKRIVTYPHNGLSNRKLLLAIMSLLICLLSNFTYICCHQFRVPLGTAREERSLLWQQSDRTVSATKADKKEAEALVFSIVLDLLLPTEMLKIEPRAWTSS
jgi:hypothetical protein